MHRVLPFSLASLLLASGCATTKALAPDLEPRSSETGLYTLELSRSFAQTAGPNDSYDTFFVWTERDWLVGVILDQPAVGIDLLDEAVQLNARESDVPTEVVRVRDVELGGLHARRTEIVVEVEGTKLLMLNTHTSVEEGNLQIVVSGPLADARALRELGDQLERGGFRFERQVAAFKPRPPYDLDDKALPIRFSQAPGAWVTARPGSVNQHAFLELRQPDADTWFMAFHEVLEGEIAEAMMENPAHMERYARAMHDEMASVLKAAPSGDLEPFDPGGEEGDRRWSLRGHFGAEDVPTEHRFRLVQRGPELLRMYCWGPPPADVKRECDALYDVISLTPLADEPASEARAAE